jgi:hypothetical protein
LGLGGSSLNPSSSSSSSSSPSSSGSSSSSPSSALPVQGFPVTPPVAAASSNSSSSSSSSVSSSTAGSTGSSSIGSSSSSSSSGLGFRQPSSQLLLSCDEGAWGVVGLMLVAWLHWHCGVSQATAIESVSQALGVTLNEVGCFACCYNSSYSVLVCLGDWASRYKADAHMFVAWLHWHCCCCPEPRCALIPVSAGSIC